MIHFELQRLLQQNLNLHTQLSQRQNCLRIQMASVDEQAQINSLVDKLLMAQNQWKNNQANNLLNLQQKLLFKAQRLEQIARYQRTIEQLMCLLNNKQKQIAFEQNQGKSFKTAGVTIEKLIYQQGNQSGIATLMEELQVKDELQKQISKLQIHHIEKQQSKENIDKLQFILLQQLMKQQLKNKKLKNTFKQLYQQIQTYQNNAAHPKCNDGNKSKYLMNTAKTISQTSDQD